jgi:Plavaka transposase
LRPSGRPNRKIRIPLRYVDELPPQPPIVPPPIFDTQLPSTSAPVRSPSFSPVSSPTVNASTAYQAPSDAYGVYRLYRSGRPSYTPDDLYSLRQVSDSDTFSRAPNLNGNGNLPRWGQLGALDTSSQDNLRSYFSPFPNASIFRLMCWFFSGSNLKSLGELDRLVSDVFLAKDFCREDFVGFRASREGERLDNQGHDPLSRFSAEDGWIETTVNVSLPVDGRYIKEADAPQFPVPGLFYRPLLEVIKAALHDTAAEHFHPFPFQTYWKPSPNSSPERIYTELYTSDAFITEHEKLLAQPREPGCDLEPVIVAIMLWSDSTHLANFGTASLWPIYLYIGNQSKYARGKPTSFAAHHLAYIPKVRSLPCASCGVKLNSCLSLSIHFRISIEGNLGSQPRHPFLSISDESLCKLSGYYYLMTGSLTRTSMGQLWNVRMALLDASFRASLLIHATTLRSMLYLNLLVSCCRF